MKHGRSTHVPTLANGNSVFRKRANEQWRRLPQKQRASGEAEHMRSVCCVLLVAQAESFRALVRAPTPVLSAAARRPPTMASVDTVEEEEELKVPMRVQLIVEPTPFTHVSGYANRFKEYLKYQKKAGAEVSIITPAPHGPSAGLYSYWGRRCPGSSVCGCQNKHAHSASPEVDTTCVVCRQAAAEVKSPIFKINAWSAVHGMLLETMPDAALFSDFMIDLMWCGLVDHFVHGCDGRKEGASGTGHSCTSRPMPWPVRCGRPGVA